MSPDLRFGRAFDAAELVRQQYRAMSFWASVLTVTLIAGAVAALVARPMLWLLVGLALVVRVILAMATFYDNERLL